ncbi:DUF4422 domain-containing protein [uncultured Clostridium sp.]|uniref:DUF4422 domain-containing protein n=1 Tax=uncultured Clostridium sp. TaxID=59620 RepID=UPI0025F30E1C|nr:DUF4422 domain-containing protein [uncultured Clostridium sp.]
MSKELVVYMATHDKRCSHTADYDYIVPIQVGKALNEMKIEDVSDNTGDNISLKNKTYCELTALYWMWKNDKSKYIGLYHYRRMLDIKKRDILNRLDSDYIILPKKRKFKMSVKDQYIREHSLKDWNVLIDILKEYYPEYYESSKIIFNNNELYRFNMFIMKKDLFDDYCEWLFPLLLRVEGNIKNTEKDNYQIRYIGFMAERLFTLYVLHNKFNIFETDVLFMNKKIKNECLKNIINNLFFRLRNR